MDVDIDPDCPYYKEYLKLKNGQSQMEAPALIKEESVQLPEEDRVIIRLLENYTPLDLQEIDPITPQDEIDEEFEAIFGSTKPAEQHIDPSTITEADLIGETKLF